MIRHARSATLLAALLAALPALAQDRPEVFRLGDDVFAAGATVELGTEGADDAFAAGGRIGLAAPLAGSAHLAGRRVDARAAVGGDLYAAGADVTVAAGVAGDATLAGYDVTVGGAVGADLRAMGVNLRVEAPVGGTALLTGQSVTIDGAIAGDAAIAADELAFGPEARIDGRLTLLDDDGALVVPDRVIPAERVDRWTGSAGAPRAGERRPSVAAVIGGFLVGVLVVAILATLAAVLARDHLERARDIARERPFRTFWIGFLALSALIGASLLLVLTLVGILVAPAVILLAAGLGFLGYVIAVYLVGRALWGWFGALPPDTFAERAVAALLGALAAGLIALVPFLGWLAMLVLTLTGLGALTVAVLRPELRSDY